MFAALVAAIVAALLQLVPHAPVAPIPGAVPLAHHDAQRHDQSQVREDQDQHPATVATPPAAPSCDALRCITVVAPPSVAGLEYG